MGITKQQLAAQLQQGNYLYFERPVHVDLGRIIITDPMGTSTPPFKYKPVVELSTYGIHLVETDDRTIVQPVPISEGWLRSLGFKQEGVSYSIGITGYASLLSIKKHNEPSYGWINKLVWSGGGLILPPLHHVHNLQNLYAGLAPGHYLKLKT